MISLFILVLLFSCPSPLFIFPLLTLHALSSVSSLVALQRSLLLPHVSLCSILPFRLSLSLSASTADKRVQFLRIARSVAKYLPTPHSLSPIARILCRFLSIILHYSFSSEVFVSRKNSNSNDGHISFIIVVDMVSVFALYYSHTFPIRRSDIIIYYMFKSFVSMSSMLCNSVVSLYASLIVFYWQLNYFVSSHCKRRQQFTIYTNDQASPL